MRIAQLVSNAYPVNSRSNQAIYSHVATLANDMTRKGHEVDVFASADSCTQATLHAVEIASSDLKSLPPDIQKYWLQALIADCYTQAERFDVIHSHFTLLSSFYADLVSTPTLLSVHSPIRPEIRPFLEKYKHLSYVSFSHAQRLQMPELNWVATVYHGVDTKKFAFSPTSKEYFLYLGRVTEEKGVHYAIQAAKAAGACLLIAGRSYQAEGYWHRYIEPEINGVTVRYVGEADLEKKIELLQGAKALLFPTQYDETFGLVMIEAMACGTPVIGWRSGAVPEVVAHGVSGFVVETVEEMVRAMRSIGTLRREDARLRVERYFSQEKMCQGYERVYQRIIQQSALKD